MKKRTEGFLAPDQIDHGTEIFYYIQELHEYLWGFVRVVCPEASGYLEDFVDDSLEIAKSEQASRDSLSPAERYTWLWKFIRLLHPEAEGELVDLVEDAAKKIVDLMQQEPSSHFAIEQEVIKFMENERMTSCVFKDRTYRYNRYRLKVDIEIIE
jgi:hypothetical protein